MARLAALRAVLCLPQIRARPGQDQRLGLQSAELGRERPKKHREADGGTKRADRDECRLASPLRQGRVFGHGHVDDERIIGQRVNGGDLRGAGEVARAAIAAAAALDDRIPGRVRRQLPAHHGLGMRKTGEHRAIAPKHRHRAALPGRDRLVEILEIGDFDRGDHEPEERAIGTVHAPAEMDGPVSVAQVSHRSADVQAAVVIAGEMPEISRPETLGARMGQGTSSSASCHPRSPG